jgi:lipoprotein-releasing system permease protein
MNWVRWVARRYLKAKKNTKFLSLSSSLSMGGIGLGVAAIIVVLSVMKGFEIQMSKKLVSTDLHVLLQPKSGFPGFDQGMIPMASLESFPAYASMKSNPQVESFSPMLSSEVILRNGTRIAGVMLKGVAAERMQSIEKKTPDHAMPQMLVDRDESGGQRLPGLFIGKELADDLALIPGDLVTAISPSVMDGPFANIPRMKRFVVEGIYRFGSPEQEMNIAYTPMVNMEGFLRRRATVTEVEVTLHDPFQARNWVKTYQSQMPELSMKDWYALNASLFASMKLERIAMFMILLFTVMIASLNIVSTLTLMVQEKIKDVTILRIMGSTSRNISGVFVWKGVLIGGLGVAWGTVIAIVVCVLLGRYEIITLPDVYYDRTMPVAFEWEYFIGVPIVSFLIVLFASWFPAKKAAQLTPMEGIRGV